MVAKLKGWRVGRRETFFEKAHGVLYSGRKHKSTQAGFIGACVLSVAFGLGATLSGIDLAVDTPMSPGMFPEANTGKVATFVAMGGLAVIAAVKGRIDECNHYIKLAFKLNKRSFSAEYAKALVEQSEGNTNGAENRVKGLLAQSSHLSDFTYAQLVARVVESVGND